MRKCLLCMKKHKVKKERILERIFYKEREISYIAEYAYCREVDKFMEIDDMYKKNLKSMEDAYNERIL